MIGSSPLFRFVGLTVLVSTATIADAQQFPGAADSMKIRAVPAKSIVRPGDQIPIAVVLQHAAGFHSWPNVPVVPPQLGDVVPIPTTIDIIAVPAGTEVQEIQWPRPAPVTVRYTRRPVELLSYIDTAVAYVPLQLDQYQPLGETTVELRVRYQVCDESVCYPPETVDLSVPLTVVAAGIETSATTNEPALFEGFGLGTYSGSTLGIPAYISMFRWSFSFDPRGAPGMVLLLSLALLGGLLLNATPCVLPIIPIKILGLQAAAGDPSRLRMLGGMMSLGVVAFWMVLAGAIAFISGFDAISSLFQTGWFSPLVGVIVGLAGVGMLGAFNVRLPQVLYRFNPTGETALGSFAFGVMTAVLSTPCTAPFMAGASAWAVLQPSPVTLSTFGAIGVGMALPYLLLTTRPGLLRRIPRSGPASALVKQVIGVLMLAVAAFFIGSAISATFQQAPAPPNRGYWWIVGGLVIAAGGWFAYRSFHITKSLTARLVAITAAIAVAVPTVFVTRSLSSHGPIDWVAYTPERFAESVSEGDVVVMDFTAEWCLNCKVLELAVLHQESIVKLFDLPGVVPMRADLTTENLPGQAKLKELGWVGIPLLAVFGPGTGYDSPVLRDSYTVSVVREAVVRATGIIEP